MKYKCNEKTVVRVVYTEERCPCGHIDHTPHQIRKQRTERMAQTKCTCEEARAALREAWKARATLRARTSLEAVWVAKESCPVHKEGD